MATWPSGIYTPLVRGTNLDDTVTHTDIHDGDVAEIVAIEQSLGVGVKGSEASVAARLAALDDLRDCICSVWDGGQTITDNMSTVINPWGSVIVDPLSWSVGSGRVRPTVAGYYVVEGGGQLVSAATTVQRIVGYTRKNGSNELPYLWNLTVATGVSTDQGASGVSKAILMNGTTDYFELVVAQDDTGGTSRSMETFMTVRLLYPS